MFKLFQRHKEVDQQAESKSFVHRLKEGLARSTNRLSQGIADIFSKRKLDQEALDELEELLISSDIGVKTALDIVMRLRTSRFDKEITPEEVKLFLANEIAAILKPVAQPIRINMEHKPHVILVAGVNGNGKTTTVGKLAAHYQEQGFKVMMAACDTFRAAAVGQLEVWAQRVGCPIIVGQDEADPASVAFQAIERAKRENIDILLVDTAGRLHTKLNLMEQLGKVVRVLKKVDGTAPHHTVLVLDATTGQNANQQVKEFKQAVNIDGLIVTKLDGTAKGGVVVSLAQEFKTALYAVGVGEAVDDLQPFDAEIFARNLVGMAIE